MLPSFYQAIGSDRYLTCDELRAGVGEHPALADAWTLYRGSFNGYCETGLDPQWHRLAHPAQALGRLESMPGERVLVLGNGPSAIAALPLLIRMRDRVRLFTSPRGAELLAANGLVPDLVVVEHRTAIDAHHAARHVRDAGVNALLQAPLVAAEWRTPCALLSGVAAERLFVPEPLPTWGLWPATAVALAANAGAARIGLLGVDLGTTERPDQAFGPLNRLLALIARVTTAETVDCGAAGARKRGWKVERLDAFEADRSLDPLRPERTKAASIGERVCAAQNTRTRLAPIVEQARQLLSLGLRARSGERVHGLEEAVNEMLSWSRDVDLRIDLQEGLGLSFLPRLWRTGIDVTLGQRLWRPIVLGAHEMVAQAGRLDAIVERVAA
jgi:hypothetical protein